MSNCLVCTVLVMLHCHSHSHLTCVVRQTKHTVIVKYTCICMCRIMWSHIASSGAHSSSALSAAPCPHAPCAYRPSCVCDSFCPRCSRSWLAIISGCVLCYRCAAEPSHNNARTEALHALRRHDSAEHQWLAYIQSAQLLSERQLGFLAFARSGVLSGHELNSKIFSTSL